MIPPLRGWTLAAIPFPSFCHHPKGQVAVTDVHLSVHPSRPATISPADGAGSSQSLPPAITSLAESSGRVMEGGRRCSACSQPVGASSGSVRAGRVVSAPHAAEPGLGWGRWWHMQKPPAPAPAAGKGTSGCPGPFTVLNLEKVLGRGCTWQWDWTGLTGESVQALRQGRHKTKVLVVLSALTVIFYYYLTFLQAQHSERGQLGPLLCSYTASAVC